VIVIVMPMIKQKKSTQPVATKAPTSSITATTIAPKSTSDSDDDSDADLPAKNQASTPEVVSDVKKVAPPPAVKANGVVPNNKATTEKEEEELEGPKKKKKMEKGGNTPFQRVKPELSDFLDKRMFASQRNANSEWAGKADATLKQVKGKGFRHEKTKKKRGTYRGGALEMGVKSIKFED